ncbi:hypothetical protein [Paenibacillus caui]|uniref:hypothetical protein n=1 Tax=Paenibacillus caui TaxID=2873927 RepID=UPI001CAA27F5|nr:hypothetical protein [Paenibacillus caui]
MLAFGSELVLDSHFREHLEHHIPVQIYFRGIHEGIGRITGYNRFFVEIEGTLYNRKSYSFISRPGY